MSNLNFAMQYAELGWSVVPLIPRQKRPIKGFAWKKYQAMNPTSEEIKEWWNKWPEANIGIVTGSISNLCVVDFDGADSVERFENPGW